jgi:hypothetical protein
MASVPMTKRFLILACALFILTACEAHAETILFVGNSFTYGHGSVVMSYRPDSVTDLNHERNGGVPALFKSFTVEAGLTYEVFLETHPGAPLAWHFANKLDVITQQPWDHVVLQGHSVLDPKDPGNPHIQIAATAKLAEALREKNPRVEIHLTATWPRADQVYQATGHWYGKSVEDMAGDLRAGADQAAATDPAVKSVLPVGEAWIRAFHDGIADPDPYDGIDAGKIDLWADDNYHASSYGYYLEALIVFGGVTGRDPRSLGAAECSAFELGMTTDQVRALQKVAFDQLSARGASLSVSAGNSDDLPRECSGTIAHCSAERRLDTTAMQADITAHSVTPDYVTVHQSSLAAPQRCSKPN